MAPHGLQEHLELHLNSVELPTEEQLPELLIPHKVPRNPPLRQTPYISPWVDSCLSFHEYQKCHWGKWVTLSIPLKNHPSLNPRVSHPLLRNSKTECVSQSHFDRLRDTWVHSSGQLNYLIDQIGTEGIHQLQDILISGRCFWRQTSVRWFILIWSSSDFRSSISLVSGFQ